MAEKNKLFLEIETLQAQAHKVLVEAKSENDLQAWHTTFLGRSAVLIQIFTRLGEVPKEERPATGQFANQVKQNLESEYQSHLSGIRKDFLEQTLKNERLDVSLPGLKPIHGRLHPETQTLREIYHIFAEMGFQVFRSPDVETDEINFELLNIPAYHPAREMFDTFYTTNPGVILRTHTSPGQIRAMREFAPEPIRVILPGMCYRYEQISTRHEIQFYQVELLAVGRQITFGNLRATLDDFCRRMFGQSVRTRFRPSYFPFTEPSAELDVECFVCGGKGCTLCKGSGWLEILGCGMVHPIVLKNGGYDPQEFSGFAAGMGPERITLLRHHIDDIRNFWANDLRFLEQF